MSTQTSAQAGRNSTMQPWWADPLTVKTCGVVSYRFHKSGRSNDQIAHKAPFDYIWRGLRQLPYSQLKLAVVFLSLSNRSWWPAMDSRWHRYARIKERARSSLRWTDSVSAVAREVDASNAGSSFKAASRSLKSFGSPS